MLLLTDVGDLDFFLRLNVWDGLNLQKTAKWALQKTIFILKGATVWILQCEHTLIFGGPVELLVIIPDEAECEAEPDSPL